MRCEIITHDKYIIQIMYNQCVKIKFVEMCQSDAK